MFLSKSKSKLFTKSQTIHHRYRFYQRKYAIFATEKLKKQNETLCVYHGDGEIDTFLSLLMTLKPTAESLHSCLIPAPFFRTEMGILSLSCLGRDEILSMGIPWHSSNNISVTSKSVGGTTFSREEQSSSTDSLTSLHKSSIPICSSMKLVSVMVLTRPLSDK